MAPLAGTPLRCGACGEVGTAIRPEFLVDANQNGIPDVVEAMMAQQAAAANLGVQPVVVAVQQAQPKGVTQADLARIPPSPRTPSEKAKSLVLAYQGGQAVQRSIGLAFMGMGFFISTIFNFYLPLDIVLAMAATPATAEVTKVENTNTSVNKVRVREVYFKFPTKSGLAEGSSCTTSPSFFNLPQGSKVAIEYFEPKPSISRIKGTTISSGGYLTSFTLLFPFVGTMLFLGAWRSNRKEIRAFVHGTPAIAHVRYIGPDTSAKVNGRHPTMVTYDFEVHGKTYKGSISHMDPTQLSHVLGHATIAVLYDPQDPSTNTIWVP